MINLEAEHIRLIREKLKNLSHSPGCYLWKNKENEVIYVGKALKLSERVRSYLNPRQSDAKTKALQEEIYDLDWVITNNEEEALILEATLIKKYSPRFNVRLKDDKRYPYICISIDEMFPRVYTVRKVKHDGKRYFGPFSDGKASRDVLKLIQKTFPLRKTNIKLPQEKVLRPCLNFHIKRCLGPCQKNISQEEYSKVVEQVVHFLEGKKDVLEKELEVQMMLYSEKMEFEKAALIRDSLDNIRRIRQKQTVINPGGGNEDIVAYARKDDEGQIVIFEIRSGIFEDKKTFALNGLNHASAREILVSFLEQYYLQAQTYPERIILPILIKNDVEPLLNYLGKLLGKKPRLLFPTAGDKKSLLKLAEKNAEMNLTERILATKLKDQSKALKELQENLKLFKVPSIIECYDISHFQGAEPVGSGVMFVDGKPYKPGYRHYKIKAYTEINDPGMIHEVIARRLQKLLNEEESLPDLIVIDGGLTQLNRACEAAIALGLDNLPMIGLAKKREEIYIPGIKEPYSFDINSASMRLLRQLRDEAHRFGVTYHRKRRDKSTMSSMIETLPDIGEKRRKALLKFFAGKEGLENASLEDLKKVPGIGDKLAEKIYEFILNKKGEPNL
ncbi:MAG: excinuclease ABC subunit UvrC [Leptospiraceae bacterium]|nr:excinuclease ABC subunit UvrC [Leptospiraceae bacterium]